MRGGSSAAPCFLLCPLGTVNRRPTWDGEAQGCVSVGQGPVLICSQSRDPFVTRSACSFYA